MACYRDSFTFSLYFILSFSALLQDIILYIGANGWQVPTAARFRTEVKADTGSTSEMHLPTRLLDVRTQKPIFAAVNTLKISFVSPYFVRFQIIFLRLVLMKVDEVSVEHHIFDLFFLCTYSMAVLMYKQSNIKIW
jgi:hypothetical protein